MIDEVERYINRIFAPIIVFTGCEDIVTEEMKAKISLERLATPLSDTGTDYEAMVYLHTASLAIPFSKEWYDIYAYLFSKYYPEKAGAIGVYSEKITEFESCRLADLKKWIYKQQMTRK